MIYAKKIRMKSGFEYSNNQVEIDQIYLYGTVKREGWYKKADIYDFIKYNNGVVKVNINPYPELIPAISVNGEKYVKSVADDTYRDNLMSLPRE